MIILQLSLELGGNAAFIVFDDCDLNQAVTSLMQAKFRNAGQACIAANRILVQNGVYEKFAELLSNAVASLKCGDGFEKDSTVGPLINKNGLSKVLLLISLLIFVCFQYSMVGTVSHNRLTGRSKIACHGELEL